MSVIKELGCDLMDVIDNVFGVNLYCKLDVGLGKELNTDLGRYLHINPELRDGLYWDLELELEVGLDRELGLEIK